MPATATAVMGAAQSVEGSVQAIISSIQLKKLMKQRKAFQTPEEVMKILQATQGMAGQGFDAFTLNYLSGEADKSVSSALGVASRLGGDPNTLSTLLSKHIDNIMKIGEGNHAEMMKNFGNYLNALGMVASNKEAEWASQQDILKDKMQAAAGNKAAGYSSVNNGMNTYLSGISNQNIQDLYAPKKAGVPAATPVPNGMATPH